MKMGCIKAYLTVMVLILPLCIAMKDFPQLSHVRTKTSEQDQAQAAMDLITRLIQDRAADFSVKVNQTLGPKDKDTFRLSSLAGGRILVEGTSGVAVSMGFYYYIKYFCNGQRTWAGQQTKLPKTLPAVAKPFSVTTSDRFRHYINVCTQSYSYPWWQFDQWEKEIDWMALHGINMPLAFTGQEAIFNRVYLNLGLTQPEIDEFFGGPGFLAWARMGNTHGWGGPLPAYWKAKKLALQHQILTRMRSLGMTPILPGFGGHVPKNISRVFPKANITQGPNWMGFGNYSRVYMLDFNDPLFVKIGGMYIQEMTKEFGSDHLYNADTFNEMTPQSSDPAYLANASKSVYEGMLAGDPQAVWVMQAWLFLEGFWTPPRVKALVTAVPIGRMILLDLATDMSPVYSRFESYYGQPFIWCMFGNNGGTMELYGELERINKGPFDGRRFPNSTMIGIGMTMEGINQNEVNYEFFSESAWMPIPRNITGWIMRFASQRYGESHEGVTQGWIKLIGSVYNCSDRHHDNDRVFLTKRPDINGAQYYWYKPEDMYAAWELMMDGCESPTLRESKLFQYDIVDITRNALQNLFVQYRAVLISSFQKQDATGVQTAGNKISELLADMDRLLGSNERFLLGSWLESAKLWANNSAELAQIEYNARNQISIWGPYGQILDYATKQWSGLIADYCKPRWDYFTKLLVNVINTKSKLDEGKYHQDAQRDLEWPFPHQTKVYPTKPTGDSVAIAQELFDKYKPQIDYEFFEEAYKMSQKRKLEKSSSSITQKYLGYAQQNMERTRD